MVAHQLASMLAFRNCDALCGSSQRTQENIVILKSIAIQTQKDNESLKSLTFQGHKEAKTLKILTLIAIMYLPASPIAVSSATLV